MEEYEKELDAKIFTEINEKNTKNKEWRDSNSRTFTNVDIIKYYPFFIFFILQLFYLFICLFWWTEPFLFIDYTNDPLAANHWDITATERIILKRGKSIF